MIFKKLIVFWLITKNFYFIDSNLKLNPAGIQSRALDDLNDECDSDSFSNFDADTEVDSNLSFNHTPLEESGEDQNTQSALSNDIQGKFKYKIYW